MYPLFLCLSLALASAGFSQEAKDDDLDVISWQEATKHIGKEITIEGRVLKAERKTGGVFLYFHQKLGERFQIIIPAKALAKFKVDPVVRYENRRIRVSGKVEDVWTNAAGVMYKYSPFIQVTDPAKITIPKPKTKPTS